MCCTVLQSVAVFYRVLQCVAVCCSVLQCVAVCCGVLQCVAVCCSVLQCVAVCCVVNYFNTWYGGGREAMRSERTCSVTYSGGEAILSAHTYQYSYTL